MNKLFKCYLKTDKYLWPSHSQTMRSIEQMLQQMGCIPIVASEGIISEKSINWIEKNCSNLILLQPLKQNIEIAKNLRQKTKFQGRFIFVNSAEMANFGATYFLNRKVLQKKDVFVACSTPELELLRWAMPHHNNVYLVPYPVVVEKSALKDFRGQYGYDKTQKVLLYAGRIVPSKNIDLLLKGFAVAAKRDSSLRLAILGDYSGEYSEKYKRDIGHLIDRYRLSEKINFWGHQSQEALAQFMCLADGQISLSTYRDEEFGYSLSQGMACGLPTVVTKWGGGVDFVDGGAAFGISVTKEMSERSVAKAILQTVGKKVWARRSKSYFQKKLSARVISKKWRELLKTGYEMNTCEEIQFRDQFIEKHLGIVSQVQDPKPFRQIQESYRGLKISID